MRSNKRSGKYIALMALCACGFAGTAVLVHLNALQGLDRFLINAIQGMESPALTSIAKSLSWIGEGFPLISLMVGIMLFLFLVLGHRKELILFAGAAAGSALLNLALKTFFRRPRPELNRLADAAGFSFPSAHSMAAFSLYGILAFLLWDHARSRSRRTAIVIICPLLILGIGLSRIYLGVHYPSDIIGGYWASGFWLSAAIWTHHRLAGAKTR